MELKTNLSDDTEQAFQALIKLSMIRAQSENERHW